MPWTKPTLQEMRDRFRGDMITWTNTGDAVLRRSVENAFSYAVPGLTNGQQGYLDWIGRQAIPSEDSDLDSLLRWANDLLTPPQVVATPAKGSVIFTGTTGTINAGTEVTNRDGAAFTTDSNYTLSGGTITGAVTAVEAGAFGNTLAGASVFIGTPVTGFDPEALVETAGLTGGADDEDALGVLNRLRVRLSSAPRGGASGDYIAWALEISSVDRAYEFPQDPTIGWAKVVVVDDTGGTAPIAGSVTIDSAQANIDLKRPKMMGGCTVIAANGTSLSLTWINMVPAPGDSAADGEAAIAANVDAYILTQTTPGVAVNVNEIENAAQAVVTSVTLSSPTVDPDPGAYGLFDTISHNF